MIAKSIKRRLGLDKIETHAILGLETTMTNSPDVKAAVIEMIKKCIKPGSPVTPKVWRTAYDIVRAQAIADTIIWKQNYITISLQGGH